ncbi:hypothetical protein A5625_15345 [Mycobacterium sp. 1465703.0]|nr:hypothetical protein A5625_15345 [Mycobacterium sp. 1465703.0]
MRVRRSRTLAVNASRNRPAPWAEPAAASAQSQGTLSTEDRCERIWDMSPDETKQNMTRLTTDTLMGLPTGPAGAGSSTPPGPPAPPATSDTSPPALAAVNVGA